MSRTTRPSPSPDSLFKPNRCAERCKVSNCSVAWHKNHQESLCLGCLRFSLFLLGGGKTGRGRWWQKKVGFSLHKPLCIYIYIYILHTYVYMYIYLYVIYRNFTMGTPEPQDAEPSCPTRSLAPSSKRCIPLVVMKHA